MPGSVSPRTSPSPFTTPTSLTVRLLQWCLGLLEPSLLLPQQPSLSFASFAGAKWAPKLHSSRRRIARRRPKRARTPPRTWSNPTRPPCLPLGPLSRCHLSRCLLGSARPRSPNTVVIRLCRKSLHSVATSNTSSLSQAPLAALPSISSRCRRRLLITSSPRFCPHIHHLRDKLLITLSRRGILPRTASPHRRDPLPGLDWVATPSKGRIATQVVSMMFLVLHFSPLAREPQ
mmetsp:Transcript_36146/g.82391  ORF Transcript_36146/g.82391 Transcript_36146/m.82391 type:complete len:232 (-) Transcript_36146:18-713(-)